MIRFLFILATNVSNIDLLVRGKLFLFWFFYCKNCFVEMMMMMMVIYFNAVMLQRCEWDSRKCI